MSAFPQNIGIGFNQMVWLFSGFTGYNSFRTIGYPAYLSLKQQARLEQIRQARMLRDGRHADYFCFEGRTQFDFPTAKSQGREISPYVPYNLLDLISLKAADLLFGAEPAIRVENEIQSQKIEDLAERTSLHQVLYHAAAEASCDREAFLECVIENGQVYVKRVDAADIFPEGKIQPDGQYASYAKYNARNLGDDQNPNWILLVTRYLPGKIIRQVKQLDQTGALVPRELTLNIWPQEDPEEEPIEPETVTGIDRNTITWIPNKIVREHAVSDYDGLVELQDLLNAKRTQIARVLSQHSDPGMAMPRTAFKPDGTIDSRYKVVAYDDPNLIPRYITWDAQLASAYTDFLDVRGSLLLKSETSPILLGIKDHATAHVAYKSVRLEATNSITKAGRSAVIFRGAIKRVLGVAQDLEQTIPGVRYDRQKIGVEMADGLPIDTDAQATEIQTMRAAECMSVEGALELRIPDPVARAKELARILAEKAAVSAGTPPPTSDVGLPAAPLENDPAAEGQTDDATADGAGIED